MGITMQQLGQIMTAQEFGMHYALEQVDPLPPAQWKAVASLLASQANGMLKPPEPGRIWRPEDFAQGEVWVDPDAGALPEGAPEETGDMTVAKIMDSARKAGMVH